MAWNQAGWKYVTVFASVALIVVVSAFHFPTKSPNPLQHTPYQNLSVYNDDFALFQPRPHRTPGHSLISLGDPSIDRGLQVPLMLRRLRNTNPLRNQLLRRWYDAQSMP